jgi:hypothetical protein
MPEGPVDHRHRLAMQGCRRDSGYNVDRMAASILNVLDEVVRCRRCPER